MNGIQLSLSLMPSKIDELYIDQVRFLPCMATEDKYKYLEDYGYHFKSSSELRKMDSDYCKRIKFQEQKAEIVKEKLLNNVTTIEKLWKEYFKKNAKIYKSKFGTLTFVNNQLEKEWKSTKKETDKMLKYVGESSEALREEIICNEHLHACIKENLLQNLDRILEERNKELCLRQQIP
jgi:hypothetical protein